MRVDTALALRHLEVVVHVNGAGKRRGGNAGYEERGPRGNETCGRGQ